MIDELAEQARLCTECPLAQNKRCAYGVGTPGAELLVVYSWYPEHLLSVLFPHIPMYETTLTKCERDASGDLYTEDIEACSVHLSTQIATLDPQVIVASGRDAALALGAQSDKRWRGRCFNFGSYTVITTFHPDILDAVPEALEKIELDLTAAVRVYDNDEE